MTTIKCSLIMHLQGRRGMIWLITQVGFYCNGAKKAGFDTKGLNVSLAEDN